LSFVLGMDVAIEFRGGTIITYSYTGDISDSEIASAAAEVTGHTCDVSLGESLADNAQTVSLSFPTSSGLTAEVQSELTDALTSEFSGNQLELYNSQDVNPTTGAGFLGKCIVAVAFSAVVMIVYIGFRFRKIGGWIAGTCSVIALVHDMFFAYACCVVCRFDIDSNFMAVLLTILGYSINATIIIYDRIRENRRLYGDSKTLDEYVNMSVTQSLGRSVHTTVTTVIAMLTVCVVGLVSGVESILGFAFPLVIGLIAGVYSSNCIAPTLWTLWQGAVDRKKAAKNN
ncbi:MAG TPA: protein translocase subunit SecF, partial [Candidatus Faeciplasma pullistercoris]|nr:protein translocase subunit SecF [Candidatus Faeciplasma pullistercoris]